MIKRSLLLLAAAAIPAAAQTEANPGTTMTRQLWQGVRDYLVQTATDVPDSVYAFRPTPEVRTFGEILGHVAGSQKMFCAMALGDTVPAEDAVEKAAKTKAALVAALKESNDYCAPAYAATDQANAATVDMFGQKRTRLYALAMNVTHNNEHYGNLVTYMRINKIVPPSSR